MTSLLDSTLVGYARSFAPETLHLSHTIDSSLHRDAPVPVEKITNSEFSIRFSELSLPLVRVFTDQIQNTMTFSNVYTDVSTRLASLKRL